MAEAERIERALGYAHRFGQIDGDHHKAWVIDQMVRALTGCPVETRQANDSNGKPYEYKCQGGNDEYWTWITGYADGEDGPDTYVWDTGIAP